MALIARLELRMFCVAALSVVAACGAAVDPDDFGVDRRAAASSRVAARGAGPPDGSLAALTAEVRQLRVAVEDPLEANPRRKRWACTCRRNRAACSKPINSSTPPAESSILRPRRANGPRGPVGGSARPSNSRAVSPETRAEIDDTIKALQFEQARIDRALAASPKPRKRAVSGRCRSEETRWNELISRLEALAR